MVVKAIQPGEEKLISWERVTLTKKGVTGEKYFVELKHACC